jgi:hypothetical protein
MMIKTRCCFVVDESLVAELNKLLLRNGYGPDNFSRSLRTENDMSSSYICNIVVTDGMAAMLKSRIPQLAISKKPESEFIIDMKLRPPIRPPVKPPIIKVG